MRGKINGKTERQKSKVKQRVEKMASFTSLPDSVLIQILSYLDYPLLVRSTRVCSRWHRLAYDPSLWKTVSIRMKHASKVEEDTIARLIPYKTNLISSVNLTNCTGVKDVSLEHISLHCPNLRNLFLSGCHFITDIGIFALARNCNVLETVSIPLKNISEKALTSLVQNNPGVKKLYAYSIAVTENTIKAISTGCPELEKLIVYEASLEDDQRSSCDVLTDKMVRLLANGCRKLRKLTLRYNQVLVTDRSLASLAKRCRKLESFVIDYCDKDGGITDFGVCTIAQLCRNLKCLNISNGVITDVSLIVIADNLPCLEDLSLEFSEITDVGVYALMNRCEKLSRLIVHNSDSLETGITDNAACVIANYACDDFRSLGLGFADITDEGLKTICYNVELTFLSINGCSKLTYEGLRSCFCYLDGLWNLDISFTDIVNDGKQLLEIGDSLPYLDTLDITDCFGITQESVKAFKEKFPHCKVNM